MTGQTQAESRGLDANSNYSHQDAEQHSAKISHEFAKRLAALPPDRQVRAIVLPAPYLVSSNGARVQGEERQARLREARTRTEETFADVDKVLAKTGGKRLTECGNALSFIVVETCRRGIAALAELGWVGTVIEDQAIRPVHQVEPSPTR
jgi:hypothetical protein